MKSMESCVIITEVLNPFSPAWTPFGPKFATP